MLSPTSKNVWQSPPEGESAGSIGGTTERAVRALVSASRTVHNVNYVWTNKLKYTDTDRGVLRVNEWNCQ